MMDAFEKAQLRRCARLSSLRRTNMYASFLKTRTPCIWNFLKSVTAIRWLETAGVISEMSFVDLQTIVGFIVGRNLSKNITDYSFG